MSGNEYLYEITNMVDDKFSLLVQLTDFEGKSSFAMYDNFKVASQQQNYSLTLGAVFGTYSGVNSVVCFRL